MASSSSSLIKRLISRSLLSRSLRSFPAVTHPAVPVRSFWTTDAPPPFRVSFALYSKDKRILVQREYPRPSKTRDVSKPGFLGFLKPKAWKGKETDDGIYLQFDMPRVRRGSAKVSVEEDILVIDNFRIQLLEVHLFNTNAIKSEMINGVLNVYVPKFKLEERTDIIRVCVE